MKRLTVLRFSVSQAVCHAFLLGCLRAGQWGWLIVLFFQPVGVSGAEADATTLLGVEGFHVEVEKISAAARGLGIDESRLRALTQEQLQRADLKTGDYATVLVIALNVVESPSSLLAYCVEVEVRQVVHLARTSQIQLLAPTWAEGRLTMVVRTSLVRSVDGALAALLDELVHDYRLVNAEP